MWDRPPLRGMGGRCRRAVRGERPEETPAPATGLTTERARPGTALAPAGAAGSRAGGWGGVWGKEHGQGCRHWGGARGGAWRGIGGGAGERGRWKRGWGRGWGRPGGGQEAQGRGCSGCLWRHPTYTETPQRSGAVTAFRQGGARKAGTGTAEHRAPGGGGGQGPLKHLGRTLSSPLRWGRVRTRPGPLPTDPALADPPGKPREAQHRKPPRVGVGSSQASVPPHPTPQRTKTGPLPVRHPSSPGRHRPPVLSDLDLCPCWSLGRERALAPKVQAPDLTQPHQ